jgi:hypothetical protein
VGAGANDGIDFDKDVKIHEYANAKAADTDVSSHEDMDVSIHDGAKANAAGTLASDIEDTDVFARFRSSLDNRHCFIFNNVDCRELRPPSV